LSKQAQSCMIPLILALKFKRESWCDEAGQNFNANTYFQNSLNANSGIYIISGKSAVVHWFNQIIVTICHFLKSIKSVLILVQCNTSLSKTYGYGAHSYVTVVWVIGWIWEKTGLSALSGCLRIWNQSLNKDFSTNSHSTIKRLKHSSNFESGENVQVQTSSNSNSNFVTSLNVKVKYYQNESINSVHHSPYRHLHRVTSICGQNFFSCYEERHTDRNKHMFRRKQLECR